MITNPYQKGENPLFPVFLKLNQLHLLVVGGGAVAAEKLSAVLSNSASTQITLVALEISEEVKKITQSYPNITLKTEKFEEQHLSGVDVVIAAVNDIRVAEEIRGAARKHRILVNIADKPDLCDFYLGSVVKKGDLKIAVSTNGKSPTLAKRIKEILYESIPDEVHNLLDNLSAIRASVQGDIKEKIKVLDEATDSYRKKM